MRKTGKKSKRKKNQVNMYTTIIGVGVNAFHFLPLNKTFVCGKIRALQIALKIVVNRRLLV